MKKFNQLIWLTCLVFIVCCNSGTTKTKDPQKNKPAKIDTYYIAEKILDSHGILRNDPSTMIKHFTDTIGFKRHEIYCYFYKDRLITVDNRFYNEKNKPASFMIFSFDENNSCFSVLRKGNEEDDSRYYIYYHDSIIVHNEEMSKFLDDSIIRKQIIHEASIVLDSTMKLFPEFKYSFNWKC